MHDDLRRDMARRADVLRREIADKARRDPALFAAFVMRDEESGKAIEMAPMHLEWQDLFTKHRKLVLWSATEHGKSSQVIARLLWEIGRNPKVRIVLLSDTEGQAKKMLGVIARYIMKSEEYRLVFPHVIPSRLKGEGWTETAITVARQGYLKDPTVQAIGYEGALMGARTDIMVMDDILNWENTRTHERRIKVISWVQATVKGRLTRQASLWLVGTAYHREDLMHRLAKGRLFHWARYPGIVDNGDGTSTIAWAKRYDLQYFRDKQVDLGPVEYARQILCKAITDEESRFKQAWIDKMLALGNRRSPAYAFDTRKLEGVKIYTGVDLAVQRTDKSDRSAFFTVAVDPYHQNRKRILWLESGRISGPEILDRLYDHDKRYKPVQVVENNACFPPSALVATQRGPVPIALVVKGDMVLTHLGRWRPVLERTCREYKGPLCRFEVAGGPRVTCTPSHAFWARAGALGAEGWTSASELRTSQDHHVLRPTEGGRDQWCRVGEVSNVAGYDSLVYNLVVDEDHSYVVEGVAAHNSQDYILQFAATDPRGVLPLIPYTTGATKAHPEFGIEALAVEMNAGGWEIPNLDGEFPETQVGLEFAELLQEMLGYHPRAHTGDRLMAMFLAREGIVRGFVRGESGHLDVTTR